MLSFVFTPHLPPLFFRFAHAAAVTAVDTPVTDSVEDPTALSTARRSADLFARTISTRLDSLLRDPLFERSQVGMSVYDLTDDRPLFARGQQQRMRPASSMKVLTAVSALELLGADYRLATTLQASGDPDDSARVNHIYIRGGMDPLFGRDDLRSLVEALRERGVRTIVGDVVLDVTMKDTTLLGWGWCWDDKSKPLTPLIYRRGNKFADHWLRALSEAGITVGGAMRTGKSPTDAPDEGERQPLCRKPLFSDRSPFASSLCGTSRSRGADVEAHRALGH